MSPSTETAPIACLEGVRPRGSLVPQTVILSAAKDPRGSSLRSSVWILRSAQNDGTDIDAGSFNP
jgi:hypothetical protein